MNEEPKQLPAGCGYIGFDFGASYEDSQCYGGRLYDLDNCDGSLLYEPLEYIPCPQCQHSAWLETFKDSVECAGYEAAEKGLPRTYVHKPVRLEKRGDKAKLEKWWLAGYDALKLEAK